MGTYQKTSPKNFYTIQNWMTHECGLRFPKRDVYAILWGFTQDHEQWLEPTQAYIAELVGVSRVTVNKCLASLESDGWIRKETYVKAHRGWCSRYQAVSPEDRATVQAASQGPGGAFGHGEEMPVETADAEGVEGAEDVGSPCKARLQPLVNEVDSPCKARLQPLVNEVDDPCKAGLHQYLSDKERDTETHTHTCEGVETTPGTAASGEVSVSVWEESARREADIGYAAELFAVIYPKKPSGRVTKAAVSRALDRVVASGAAFEDICASAIAYGAFERSQGRTERYMQNAVTFLASGMYAQRCEAPRPLIAEGLKRAAENGAPTELVAAIGKRLGVGPGSDGDRVSGQPASIPCPVCGTDAVHDFGEVYTCPEHGCVTMARLACS